MVKHQPLQYYEPQLCLSCLTGIYGCRWKRYQRSHDDTTKVGSGPWKPSPGALNAREMLVENAGCFFILFYFFYGLCLEVLSLWVIEQMGMGCWFWCSVGLSAMGLVKSVLIFPFGAGGSFVFSLLLHHLCVCSIFGQIYGTCIALYAWKYLCR